MPKTRFAARDLCRPLCRTAIFCSLFVLSSCDVGKTPFATDVHKFNEDGPQQPAAITISDPQIYAQETLINDRLRERRLLEDLLKETEAIDFRDDISKPGLIRDMETIEAFLAAADVKFDQVAGLTAKREQKLADMDNEIALTRKQAELAKARKELAAAEAAELSETPSTTSQPQTTTTQPQTTTTTPQPQTTTTTTTTTDTQSGGSAPKAKSILTDLRSRVTTLEGNLERLQKTFGERKVTVPIPDAERMRDAYRAELRHRLNAVNLDDLHDHDGNSLFRLQFKAAVMPGQYKDKVGVARLTFLPPVLTNEDVRSIYFSWLTHLANRLNSPFPEGRRQCPRPSTSLLQLQNSGLVEFVKLDVRPSFASAQGRQRSCRLYVPIPPRQRARHTGFAVVTDQSVAILDVLAAIHREDSSIQTELFLVKLLAWENAAEEANKAVGIKRDQARFKGLAAAEKALTAEIRKAEAERKATIQAAKERIAGKSADAASAGDASAVLKARAQNDRKEAAKAREAAARAKREAEAAQQQADAAQVEADFAEEALGRAEEALEAAEVAVERYALQKPADADRFRQAGKVLGRAEREVPRRFVELLTDRRHKVSQNEIPRSLQSRTGQDDIDGGAWVGDYPDFRRSRDGRHDRWRVTSDFDQAHDPEDALHVAAGVPYAYATSPLEKSQLISTNAKAARSMELALSAVASIQTMGLSGGLDLGYVRESAGIAEAFENKPIVIGFSDRRSPVEREQLAEKDPIYLATHQAPQVGWVFGPKVQMNPERSELRLVHGFAAHEVSADLSIPGWWPHVRTILETAWIGNLHNTGRPIRLEDETGEGFHRERFIIKLPVNAADPDGLTAYLARNTVGALLPIIDIRHVEPFWLSACTEEVEILIKGANVWRSTRAFLGGVEAKEVSVLPDMEGVAARFDMDKIFATRNESVQGLGLEQGIRLTLWTRNGEDHITLGLEGSRIPGGNGRQPSCIAKTPAAAIASYGNLAIVCISPAQICASATEGDILVKIYGANKARGTDRPVDLRALLQNARVSEPIELVGFRGDSSVYRIEFDGGPFGAAGRNLELSMTDGEDIAQAPIRLVDCKSAPAAPVQRASIVGTSVIASESNQKREFVITLKDIDPSLIDDDLRVGVLPDVPGAGGQYIASTAPPSFDAALGVHKAAFEIAKSDSTVAGQAFGGVQRRVRIALLQRQNNVVRVIDDVNGTLVYYPKKTDTDVGVSTPSEISTNGAALTFTLPLFFNEAFPTLRNSGVTASVDGQDAVKLEVDPDWSRVADRELPATIKLKNAEAKAQWDALEPNPYTFSFSLDGDGLPAIGTFSFVKTTATIPLPTQ